MLLITFVAVHVEAYPIFMNKLLESGFAYISLSLPMYTWYGPEPVYHPKIEPSCASDTSHFVLLASAILSTNVTLSTFSLGMFEFPKKPSVEACSSLADFK